jgi:hypothetical protein
LAEREETGGEPLAASRAFNPSTHAAVAQSARRVRRVPSETEAHFRAGSTATSKARKMTDKENHHDIAGSNAKKDPEDWTTGDEPMTGAQHSYLHTLCEEAKEPFDPALTKAKASLRIEELQRRTGRGQSRGADAPEGSPPSSSGPDEEGGAALDELDVDGDGGHRG